MIINYISEDIILYENKLYKLKNNSKILIKNNDWHKYLSIIGWYKLPLKIIKYLNKFNNNKNRNSLFAQMDCGYDGNCLFHCIAQSLNTRNINNKDYEYLNCDIIKNMIMDQLTNKEFNDIINLYKVLKDIGELHENWDPYDTDLHKFKNLVKNKENIFWGDHILIDLIIKILNINIIIISYNEITNRYGLYNIMNIYKPHIESIILLYENDNHFKLIGNFQEHNMISLFKHRNLPIEIKNMINIK